MVSALQLMLLGAFLPLMASSSGDTRSPAAATNRRAARQWVGELETQTDCSFPLSSGRNGTANNSPAERVSLCNFTTTVPLVDSFYSWQKGLASLANWLGGPSTDASNSSDGGYAFFETSSLSVQQLPGVQAKAWLKSPVYKPTTPRGHCFRFSYNIQGVSASELRLLRVQMVPLEGHSAAPSHSGAPLIVNSILMPTLPSQQQQRSRQAAGSDGVFASPWTPFRNILINQTGWQEVVDEVWISSDSTRGKWLEGHVTYSSPYPHAFIFEAVPNLAYLQYRGYVAIDDVHFSDGPCRAECEFNSDFCQWSNDREDDFDWSLSRGSLWTSTGPVRDQLSSKHNFNFGGYAFIDSRQPHFAGSRALLTSDTLPATSNNVSSNALCFVFWVHMFGAGIGRLRVLKETASAGTSKPDGSSSTSQEIWRLSQSGPRDSWYRAQVTLASLSPFRIQLEATVGESGYGDIAVDSFRIENGSCPGLPEWSVNRGMDCTFQNGNCGWVLTNSQPGITSMWSRSSADIFTGRPNGHSQQNVLSHLTNSYLLFDTYQNGHRPGSRGYVSSQVQPSIEAQCLSFWFYIASTLSSHPRLGALEVVLFEPNATSTGTNETSNTVKHTSVKSATLWRLENHQEEKWLFAQVSFVAVAGGYISFVGIRGDSVRGVIAIDDVTLYRDSCQTLPPEASVSLLDCSFDHNLCNWSVDSQTVPLPSTEQAATEKEEETAEPTTLTPTNFASSRQNPPSESKSSPELEEYNQPSISFPVDEPSSSTEYPSRSVVINSSPTAIDVAFSFSDGPLVVELIPPDSSTSEDATSTTESPSSIHHTESIDEVSTRPTATDDRTPPLVPTTIERSTGRPETTKLSTLSGQRTTSISGKPTTESATSIRIALDGKDSSMRGVSGLYDEITSFGGNTIEVISTSRDGATKSIIISQPVRNRFERATAAHGWIGYNHPRHSRIVHLRNGQSLTTTEDSIWRRPMPVPQWLRSRHPTTIFGDTETNGRGQIAPYSVQFPSERTTSKPPKLFGVSSSLASAARPLPDKTGTDLFAKGNPRWLLSGASSSLFGVRDHTLQLPEGGYVFFEGTGNPSVSRLFSPPVPGNATYCLSFFFTMAYNSPNSTLTILRFNNGPSDELWRVTSAAIDRSGNLNKSPWIPARVPISSTGEANQTIVIEASADTGGIALDDIRLKAISCTIRP